MRFPRRNQKSLREGTWAGVPNTYSWLRSKSGNLTVRPSTRTSIAKAATLVCPKISRVSEESIPSPCTERTEEFRQASRAETMRVRDRKAVRQRGLLLWKSKLNFGVGLRELVERGGRCVLEIHVEEGIHIAGGNGEAAAAFEAADS